MVIEGLSAPRSPAGRLHGLFSLRRFTGPSAVLIVSNALTNVLRIVSTMILTRLLAPSDFGLFGIIMSIFFAVGMITDAGFQAYIVRHERGDDPDFLDAVWTAHITRGVINTLLAILLAVPAAHILHKPELAPLLGVSALSFTIDGAASLSLLTSIRNRMVRRLSMLDFIAFLAQFVVVLIAAFWLRDAWALVISILTTSVVRAAGSYLAFPNSRRRLRIDRPLLGDLWRFSRIIAMSSMLTLAILQFDKLVLARVFTLSQFGIYVIAANLASAPIALVSLYTSRIFYPAIAETWRNAPETVGRQSYALRGTFFHGYLFVAGGLVGAAPLLIRILYDPRYLGAGLFLRILAITTVLTMLTQTTNEFLVAIGRTRTTLTANLLRICWLVGFGVAGFLIMGPLGLILALALIEMPPLVYYGFVTRRLGFLDLRREMIAVGIIIVGVALGIVVDIAGNWALTAWRG